MGMGMGTAAALSPCPVLCGSGAGTGHYSTRGFPVSVAFGLVWFLWPRPPPPRPPVVDERRHWDGAGGPRPQTRALKVERLAPAAEGARGSPPAPQPCRGWEMASEGPDVKLRGKSRRNGAAFRPLHAEGPGLSLRSPLRLGDAAPGVPILQTPQ